MDFFKKPDVGEDSLQSHLLLWRRLSLSFWYSSRSRRRFSSFFLTASCTHTHTAHKHCHHNTETPFPSLLPSSPLTATHKHCHHNTETPFPSLPPPLLSPHCYTQALSPQHRDKGLAATHTTCTLRIYNIYIYIYMIVHCTLPLPTSS